MITSVANDYVKLLRSLATQKGRAEQGLFLAEGPKLVLEALRAGLEMHSVAISADAV